MGNLSSLRLFSGSIVVSPLLGWSPPHVSAGNLACLMWLGPLSSFSRPVSALVTCWVQSSKSCNRASPMHEHFASLCVHLICYHLIYQGSPIAESRVSMRRNHPVTWIQIDIEQLGDHYSNSIPRCHIKFFFLLFFERSYIAMNNWEVASLDWGISLFPQNSVNLISLALYKALASFSNAALPPP